MNVSIFSQKDYENISDRTLSENKPNSNPIKPNFRKAKMSANAFSQRIMKMKPPSGSEKTNPIQTLS